MISRARFAAVLGLAASFATSIFADLARAEPPSRVRAYYVGNSLTESAMPPFHTALGRSAGKEWTVAALIGAGAPLFRAVDDLNADAWHYGGRCRTTLTTQPWDVLVLQPAMWIGLRRKGAETAGWVKDPDREVGDIESASKIIDLFLTTNPNGRVLLYADWPGMDPLPSADNQRSKRPDKDAFDYEKAWLRKYDPDAKWKGGTFASRDYKTQLMEALKAKYPKLWSSGRLTMIPVGEVFFALNRKLRAGKLAGLSDIEDFYTDLIHVRSGLPRYAVAATFFAVIFGEPPSKLDWKIYADAERYRETNDERAGAKRFFVNLEDLGAHLDLDADRAKLVNDTIWEVVTEHPYTGLAKAK